MARRRRPPWGAAGRPQQLGRHRRDGGDRPGRGGPAPADDLRDGVAAGARRPLAGAGDAAERLAAAGRAYAAAPGEPTQQRLDEAVDAAFDLPIGPAALRELASELRRRRTDAGG
ncbi:MAG: hypothetical protein U5J98_00740 [Halobacteriales archaeon]|nr:hypothetical protein [Halobacteriales archaeon]